MPRFVYTLFSSTEPDMDDYMALDLPKLCSSVGFEDVWIVDSDHTDNDSNHNEQRAVPVPRRMAAFARKKKNLDHKQSRL